MSVRQSLLFISMAALAVAGTAAAQDRDQTFRDRDRNNDGVLTQGEYGGHPGNFQSLDTNGDGVLSYDEFVRRNSRADNADFADPFNMMDRNHDGFLTIREYTGRDPVFRRMDANDDGLVSRAEFNNQNAGYPNASRQRRFEALDQNNDGRLTMSESRMRPPEFRQVDVNHNQYISLYEFMRAEIEPTSARGFEALDVNNDGRISWGEWRGDHYQFARLDRNDDRYLTRAEFENRPVSNSGGPYGGTVDEFRAMDRNDDGVLTRNESRMDSREFDRADLNNDGVLTLKEFANTSDGNGNDQFDVLDRNNDGRISRWEWQGSRDDFDRMDRNDDGVLTRSEFDRRSSGGFLGSVLGGVENSRFNEMDTNNDGILRSSEWRGSMRDFERLDTNNDGVVTLSEYNR